MSNSQINKMFLNSTDSKTRNEVLAAVATHYGISKEEALDELVYDEAEHLLEYLTGSIRSAVSVLMQRRGLGVAA